MRCRLTFLDTWNVVTLLKRVLDPKMYISAIEMYSIICVDHLCFTQLHFATECTCNFHIYKDPSEFCTQHVELSHSVIG
jgi:hypothetical protein